MLSLKCKKRIIWFFLQRKCNITNSYKFGRYIILDIVLRKPYYHNRGYFTSKSNELV